MTKRFMVCPDQCRSVYEVRGHLDQLLNEIVRDGTIAKITAIDDTPTNMCCGVDGFFFEVEYGDYCEVPTIVDALKNKTQVRGVFMRELYSRLMPYPNLTVGASMSDSQGEA